MMLKHSIKSILSIQNVFVLLLFCQACDDGFTSYAVVDRLRIIAIRADTPEFCPYRPEDCPPDTSSDAVTLSILAIDPHGIVADGMHPKGPYLRDNHELTWALCGFGFNGASTLHPDCTLEPSLHMTSKTPRMTLNLQEAKDLLEKALGRLPDHLVSPPPLDPQNQDAFVFDQPVAVAVESKLQREWGTKSLTFSLRNRDKWNLNPVFNHIFVEDAAVQPGDSAFTQVECGNAYRISWDIPEEKWQKYDAHTKDGMVQRKELYTLFFFSTHGSFSKSSAVSLWMADEEENELFWRPPLEVPEEGLDVTLAFNLIDGRGGSSWTWGKVHVVRGEGVLPH